MTDVIVKASKIKGKGVYANRDFKRGEVIIIWSPKKIVDRKEVPKLSKEDQNHTCYIGKKKYAVMGIPERFMNHSCNPNSYPKNQKDIALKDIKKGEEITTDYSLSSLDDWEVKCNCKSKNCRKVIFGDFRKLDPKTKKKLAPYLDDWFKKEIANA